MTGFNIIALKEMIEQLGEEKTKEILSDFYCPKNPDVEKFIRYKAIEFAKQNIAPTHLIFSSYKDKVRLIGYFTLVKENWIKMKKTI